MAQPPGMVYPSSSDFAVRLRALPHSALSRLSRLSKWQLLYFAVLCVMGVVGFIVSPDHNKTRLAYFLFGLFTFAATIAFVNSPRRFWQAFRLLTIFGLVITLVGAAGTTWTTYKLPAISAFTTHIPQAPAQFLAHIGAPDGIHPNQVAGMLTLYLSPLLGFLLFRPRQDAPRTPSRLFVILIWLTLCIMAAYMALSLSRSGLLATAVAVIFLLWTRKRAWGIAAMVAIALAAIGAYFLLPHTTLNTFITSLLSTFNGTGETRTEIWRQAIAAVRGAPLTGIGLYNFGSIFQYNITLSPDSTFVILHAHNAYLQAALDLGIPGALAYTLLLISIAWHAYRAGRRQSGSAAGVYYGFAAAILAFGIYGLFDTIPLTSRVAWLTWFSIGLASTNVQQNALQRVNE